MRFTQKVSLIQHEVRIHTGEKPFHCEHCVMRFAQKVNLIQHERIHTGEKPFQCEHCEMRYRSNSSLAKHKRRIHTGEKNISM
jgi:KRAB domain-containing zinc finger protein